MHHIKFKLAVVILFITTLIGCSINNGEDYCFYQELSPAVAVNGPETATVNQPVVFDVTFQVSNGCGEFNRFNETNEFPKEIIALADYEGCVCTQEAKFIIEKYTFTAVAAGNYELRFLTSNQAEPIIKVITVTD